MQSGGSPTSIRGARAGRCDATAPTRRAAPLKERASRLHQRDICQCPDCMVRATGQASESKQDARAIRAAELDAPDPRIHRVTTKLADGVVKRGGALKVFCGAPVPTITEADLLPGGSVERAMGHSFAAGLRNWMSRNPPRPAHFVRIPQSDLRSRLH
jgi:hypothetical protein